MGALLILCVLFFMKEKFNYVSTPTPVSVVLEVERFGYVITSTPVSFIISIEGEI